MSIFLEYFLLLILHCIIFCHLFQTVWSLFIAHRVDGSVTYVRCAREVLVRPVVIVNYSFWRIRNFTNSLVFGRADVDLSKVFDSNLERAV